jgi:hypothetical protein
MIEPLFQRLVAEVVSIMALSARPFHATELRSSTSLASDKMLFQDLQPLGINRQLLSRANVLEGLNHDSEFCGEDGSDLNAASDEQADTVSELPARMLELEQRIKLLAERISSLEEGRMRSRGKATARRIEKLKALLKVYGGSQAFKQLQNDMELSPSQFTRLVKCLDKRYFEIRRCPDAQRGEKMLSLKR